MLRLGWAVCRSTTSRRCLSRRTRSSREPAQPYDNRDALTLRDSLELDAIRSLSFQAGDSTLDAMREELAQLRMGRGPSGLVGPAVPLTAQAKRDGAVQPPSRSPSSAVRRP